MYRKLPFLAALLFFVSSLSAQTADDIVSGYIKARGGLDNDVDLLQVKLPTLFRSE